MNCAIKLNFFLFHRDSPYMYFGSNRNKNKAKDGKESNIYLAGDVQSCAEYLTTEELKKT